MLKQFYEKALPTQGVYCVSGFDKHGSIKNRYAETLDGVLEEIEKFKSKNLNVSVALGSFDGYSRKAADCLYVKSFFIDIDVGDNKPYAEKGDAHVALFKLIGATGLPDPVVVDSGGGLHAYWLMDQDIPVDEWRVFAERFRTLCMEHIVIDPVVTADASRLLRAPETFNYKYSPPRLASFITEEFPVYSWQEFKEFFGEEPLVSEAVSVLETVPKGLDDDTLQMLKLDNFTKNFSKIAAISIEGSGCNQIKNILVNADTIPEPLWFAGLSIAKFCEDGATAIHLMSEDHPEYDHYKTEQKAQPIPAPRKCEWFISNYPSECDGCQHRGKIASPILLGRELRVAPPPNTEESVWAQPDTKTIPDFPEFLMPFVRGHNGGIYFLPAPTIDKKGIKHQNDPILILPHEFFPIRRMMSPHDGECLLMRLVLPRDSMREFLLPLKHVYAQETFKAMMAYNGVLASAPNTKLLMDYVVKWGQYMQTNTVAETMRMQMGWTEEITGENWATRSFVIGNKEINYNGETLDAPSSPFVKGIAKYLKPQGTYERWRSSFDELNRPQFELHAFAGLAGFGTVLMPYTSTSGVVMSLLGKSGCGKTGALYAGLSTFGNPKELSVFDATENGLTGRYLGLKNLGFGLDEVSNREAKPMSQLVHKISHGKAKIRMQSSVNAEREHEMSASLIAIFTTNQSIYSKFEAFKANPDGEAARLIEFLVHKPDVLEGDGGAALGAKIFDTFTYNYGHAGPMFIKELFRLGDAWIIEEIAKWNVRFLKDFGDSSTYRFYQNLVAAVFTAGTIGNNANIFKLDLDRIYHEVIRSMIEIRDNVVKINRTDYPSVIGDYINKNMANILVIKDGKVTMEPRGAIVARIVSEQNLLQVSKTDFKKYLNERQISSREFEFEMRAQNILTDDKKGRLTTGWKTSISVDPTHLYWFKTQIPEEWLDTGSDQGA